MAKIKISGFSFGCNLIELDYPIVQAINSILPIVDEFIVAVGMSRDKTLELIQSIPSNKIHIIETEWDDNLRKNGLIFSEQAKIAFRQCKGDWAFFLNADEVVHEDDLPKILKKLEEIHAQKDILGLMFRYYHFEADYYTYNPWRYSKEIRLIRNDGRVEPGGDMSGFYRVSDGLFLKNGPKDLWEFSGAYIYHYGWAKSPKILQKRNKTLHYYYHNDQELQNIYEKMEERYDFGSYYKALKKFKGTHSEVMEEWIRKRHVPYMEVRNRWLCWDFYKYCLKHGPRI